MKASMIRVKIKGMEFICDNASEAADIARMFPLDNRASSRNIDAIYFPGGKRPPVIIDGIDFVMSMKLIQGKEIDSNALAKHLRLKGIQGIGPFLSRISRKLQEMEPPLTLDEFIVKKSLAGKPTFWKILRQKKSAKKPMKL